MRALLLASVAAVAGCATGQFQTARTLPDGDWRVAVSNSVLRNETRDYYLLPQISVRRGFGEHLDAGISTLFFTGGLLDGKYAFLSPANDLAVAVRAGVGYALDSGSQDARIFHVPLTVLASYRLGAVEPYVALGYASTWVRGRRPLRSDPTVRYAATTGTGDGNLTASIGCEWQVGSTLSILADYTLLEPVLDDPGDHFAFLRTHQLGFGFGFRI